MQRLRERAHARQRRSAHDLPRRAGQRLAVRRRQLRVAAALVEGGRRREGQAREHLEAIVGAQPIGEAGAGRERRAGRAAAVHQDAADALLAQDRVEARLVGPREGALEAGHVAHGEQLRALGADAQQIGLADHGDAAAIAQLHGEGGRPGRRGRVEGVEEHGAAGEGEQSAGQEGDREAPSRGRGCGVVFHDLPGRPACPARIARRC
ncbi:MAG: hypothetical protein M5U28_39205 [Sandaracinaceae bacterium]|nr:hypothetical protein [Sandaracinaceae bacterium]